MGMRMKAMSISFLVVLFLLTSIPMTDAKTLIIVPENFERQIQPIVFQNQTPYTKIK